MDIKQIHNFFFHPLAHEHSTATKILSVATVVALSVLSLSGFLIVFGIVNLRDRRITPHVTNPHVTRVISQHLPTNLPKVDLIKQKHSRQLQLFETWAGNSDWKMFKPEHSHYDWWAFPVSTPSSSYGETYAVNAKEVAALKSDESFMKNYRRAVELVVLSWGWDLKNDCAVAPNIRTKDQEWTGYGVRLGKMADSLNLFEEKELYTKLQKFFQQINTSKYPQLENWVVRALSH